MIEAELFDGTVLEFPDGTDPAVIQRTAKAQTARIKAAGGAPAPAPRPTTGTVFDTDAQGNIIAAIPASAEANSAPAPVEAPNGLLGALSATADGVRQGVSTMVGAPVDLVNNAPRLLNALPFVDGIGPLTENPIGGSASVDALLRGAGGVAGAPIAAGVDAATGTDLSAGFSQNSVGLPTVTDYEPRTATERILNRLGEEVGASAVPLAGSLGYAAAKGPQAIAQMARAPQSMGEGIAAQFARPAAVDPVGLALREGVMAGGAGLGAGLANEAAGDNQGFWSDFLGSLAGVGVTGATTALAGGLKNVVAGAVNSPQFADDVASSAVAERLMNSSATMQEQAARLADAGISPDQLNTDGLVAALRSPAAVEDAVPGYRANIADRTRDPGLATLTYNTDAVNPGAATARRTSNNVAVDERMMGLAPDGDPMRFRTDLQTGVDAQIAAAQGARDSAQVTFDDLAAALQPGMADATARGSSIRSALADAYDRAQQGVRDIYARVDDRGTLVDPAPLVAQTKAVDMNLAPNDAKRFRPVEADTIQEMMPGDRAPLRDTGLVNEFNRPVFAENAATPNPSQVPSLPGEAIGRAKGTTVPLSDVAAIRSGLTDDLRAAQRSGNRQQARILGQYIETLDGFMDQAAPEDLRAVLDEGRVARRDVGERFERPGTGLEAVLSKREGGGFAMDDSAVPSQFAQPDQGRLTDLRAALSEAGTDQRLRDGLADEVRSQVVRGGMLDKPAALGKYMADRQVLLSEFPELRAQLEAAGVSRADLNAAEKAAADTTKRLTTPGRSPEASYLKQVEDPAAALRSAIASDPRKAVADLAATAGTPQAKADLRAAFWEEVKRTGKMQADGVTGETRWNGKKLRALLDDPKLSAAAEELWADAPEELASIKEVFGALASAEGSTRARAPNTSGTAQAIGGKLDPALTASSLASRGRSVTRGQLSPTIAVVDVLGTWLRRRSAQVQSRAIDQITAAVVNNPGLAADLLTRYNPADAAARRAMLQQKYGARITTLLNTLDEAEGDEPLLDAMEDDK